MARHVLEASMVPASRYATVAHMTQEVRLFRVFHRRRSYHHLKVLAETRHAGSEMEKAEDDLLFLEDRDEFTRQQLLHQAIASSTMMMGAMLNRHDVGFSRELSLRHSLDEQRRQREAAEALLRRLHELRGELGCSQEQTAMAAARIRMLRALCTLGGGSDAELLSDKLAGMEVSLTGDGCSLSGSSYSTAALAAEFETASPLATVLPLVRDLRTRQSTAREALEQSVVDGRGPQRFLINPQARSAAGNSNSTADRAEEEGLQRLLEELTEQQITLRGQLREKQEEKASQRRKAQAREEANRQIWMSVAELRIELVACYDKLSESNVTALDEEVSELRLRCQAAEDAEAQLREGGPSLREEPSQRADSERVTTPTTTPSLNRFRPGELAALERHGSAVLRRLQVAPPGGAAASMAERRQQVSAALKLRSPTAPLSRQKLVVGSSGDPG